MCCILFDDTHIEVALSSFVGYECSHEESLNDQELELLKQTMLDEHRKVYNDNNPSARGYSKAVLKKMWSKYDAVREQDDHNRLKRILKSSQSIHSFVKKFFPDGNDCPTVIFQ